MVETSNLFLPEGRSLQDFKCIVLGASAGGVKVLTHLFKSISLPIRIPLIVAQHMSAAPYTDRYYIQYLKSFQKNGIFKEANEKEKILSGVIYFAPLDYHLLIEKDKTFSLTVDEKINYSRPSIDVLFESAARCYKSSLISILLTGSNSDGAYGSSIVNRFGGYTIVQDPDQAEHSRMPLSAIETKCVDKIMTIENIEKLIDLFSEI